VAPAIITLFFVLCLVHVAYFSSFLESFSFAVLRCTLLKFEILATVLVCGHVFCYRLSSFLFIQVGREVLDVAARAIKPGVTTDEIDRIVHEATIAAGANLLPFHC
jgi:hypothetical protein